MILPLCNFLGMMLVGLIPLSTTKSSPPPPLPSSKSLQDDAPLVNVVDMDTVTADEPERTGLTRRPAGHDSVGDDSDETDETASISSDASSLLSPGPLPPPPSVPRATWFAASSLQLWVGLSVVLDFAGCVFSNMGLAMAGSGLYQVVYSSVICWSALLSRFVLQKVVTRDEWTGIALVTFGLAFSALGESGGGRNSYVVLMGCFNTMLGAAFYGGNYGTFLCGWTVSTKTHIDDCSHGGILAQAPRTSIAPRTLS